MSGSEIDLHTGADISEAAERPCAFYYDLGSPYSYLSAERISGLFAEAGIEQPEWKPILLGGLFKRFGRDSWAKGPGRDEGMADIERRASAIGLPPIAWPEPWPGNTLNAMRAATFAKQGGKTIAFALAAFRQAFAAGRDLSDIDNVLIAGAACEIHPKAIIQAVGMRSTKERLIQATGAAGDIGVTGVPTVRVGDELFWGDDRLEEAVGQALSLSSGT